MRNRHDQHGWRPVLIPIVVAAATIVPALPAAAQVQVEVNAEASDGSYSFASGSVDVPLFFTSGGFSSYQLAGLPELTGQPFSLGGMIHTFQGSFAPGRQLLPGPYVTNSADVPLRFEITMTWHVSTRIAADWTSSSSWTLSGSPDMYFHSIDGVPLWTMLLDGATVGALYDDGPYFMNNWFPSLEAEPVGGVTDPIQDSMAIRLAFELWPGATVGAGGELHVLPAPGSLALLGLGLAVGRARRRRGGAVRSSLNTESRRARGCMNVMSRRVPWTNLIAHAVRKRSSIRHGQADLPVAPGAPPQSIPSPCSP